MKGILHRFPSRRRIHGIPPVMALFAFLAAASITRDKTLGQSLYQTQAGDMILFESAGASRVVEKVRSGSQGVMIAVFAKVGDTVKKGQILGHTELDATKLQLDLAEQALTAKATVESAKMQAEAWTVARQETAYAVRRRKMEESRLDWAIAMEKMYQANYENQLDAEKTQEIQHAYWKDQYEKRFFRAPVDGTVSEVLVEVGKPVNLAAHAFTISNETTYALPVTVPDQVADAATSNKTLPVRAADGKSVARAWIDSVIDDPRTAGRKVIKLLVKSADFPAGTRDKLRGMKFEVLFPLAAQDTDP
jgi:multidrug efflux pump subunit AcrA (membrane-fusion protein)